MLPPKVIWTFLVWAAAWGHVDVQGSVELALLLSGCSSQEGDPAAPGQHSRVGLGGIGVSELDLMAPPITGYMVGEGKVMPLSACG